MRWRSRMTAVCCLATGVWGLALGTACEDGAAADPGPATDPGANVRRNGRTTPSSSPVPAGPANVPEFSPAFPQQTEAPAEKSKMPYEVVEVASGFHTPWSIAFLPDGHMLVTEKPGRLRVVRNGQLLPDAITGTPEVLARGQGGLLEVALHPQFATNQVLYLTYSKSDETRGNTTALARGRLNGMALEGVADIFVADAWALVQVTALPSRRHRIRWIAIIVLVPIVGVALWIRRGGRA